MLERLQNEGEFGGRRNIDLVSDEFVDRHQARLLRVDDDVNPMFLEITLAVGQIDEGAVKVWENTNPHRLRQYLPYGRREQQRYPGDCGEDTNQNFSLQFRKTNSNSCL